MYVLCSFLQEIRQHLRTQRPTDNEKANGRGRYEKSDSVDSSAHGSDTIQTNDGKLDAEKLAKTSQNIIMTTASIPRDTNNTTTFKAVTVPSDTHPVHDMAAVARQPTSPVRTTAAPQYVAEPMAGVSMATDSFAIVTNEDTEGESVVPYESDFGVDNEECDCDMEDYDDDEIDGVDMFDR